MNLLPPPHSEAQRGPPKPITALAEALGTRPGSRRGEQGAVQSYDIRSTWVRRGSQRSAGDTKEAWGLTQHEQRRAQCSKSWNVMSWGRASNRSGNQISSWQSRPENQGGDPGDYAGETYNRADGSQRGQHLENRNPAGWSNISGQKGTVRTGFENQLTWVPFLAAAPNGDPTWGDSYPRLSQWSQRSTCPPEHQARAQLLPKSSASSSR